MTVGSSAAAAAAAGVVGEDEFTEALTSVLLCEEVEGLDGDLVEYISGMLASHESDTPQEVIDEVLHPFLESAACPEHLSKKAEDAVLELLNRSKEGTGGGVPGASTETTTRKLRGMVNMSSNLDNRSEKELEENRYLWGTEGGVKPMANDLIDAQQDKSSAKEKRKLRKQEAERARKLLMSSADRDVDTDASGGLVRMNYKAVDISSGNTGQTSQDKKKDVLVRNATVSLDNGTTLLEQGELKFAYQRRYGLIGENGVGKTTLLKAISRQDDVLDGFPTHLRVLHVRQEVPSFLQQDLTVTDAVLQSDVERMELLRREREILTKLEGGSDEAAATEGLSIQEKRKKLMEQKKGDMDEASGSDVALQQMQSELKTLDMIYSRLQVLSSDSADARAAMILTGLQFTPAMQKAQISSLSGGWRMRVALAAALFIEPDLLLLDEPTNHLDLEAVLWLESYLTQYNHTLVVVSHDRGFLNEVCTDICEFKKKNLTYYRGNFDMYVKLRDENLRNAMRVYEAYKAKRDHMMEFINKFRANAKRATMVQSRIKAVEKMDSEAPEPVEVDPVWRFSIPNSEPLGPPIISINDVSFDYKPTLDDGSKKPESEFLLQKVNFGVDLTSKIAILGKNGQGKTTLLNLIMGRIKPLRGSVSINGNLRIGHFTQHSADNFDLSLSAVENLLNMFEEAEDQEIRSFLGRFQIQGNDALKPMMLLSGGQKSRVAFAALAYKKPHVLVIDEGSNHLSMEAVDALVEAIQDFKGGILVVSHDEYFVSKTCEELWVVYNGQATRFRGDFEDYKKHTAEETQKRVEESVKHLNAVSNN